MFQSLHLDNFASKFIWLPSPVDRELHFVRFYHPMQIATFPGHAWLLSCPDKFRAAEMQRPFNASRGLVMLIGCSLLIGFTLPSAKLGFGVHQELPWQIAFEWFAGRLPFDQDLKSSQMGSKTPVLACWIMNLALGTALGPAGWACCLFASLTLALPTII